VFEEIVDTAESMDAVRGAMGRGSGRFGMVGGAIAVGDDGGDRPADVIIGAKIVRT